MASPGAAPRPWRPSGVVSLLTDYGTTDPYVGIVKGVLWRDASRLRAVVDLTHAVPPGDVTLAAFLLERSWASFPAGSVHVAVVDPGVGTERALLLVEARGHVFVAPDNGLLAPLVASEPLAVVRRVGARAPVRGPSTTFDGRDRFAPLAARLVEGDPPAGFGAPLAPGGHVPLALPEPVRTADGAFEAEVVHVDRFGNLITNLPFVWLAEARVGWRARWRVRAGKHWLPLARTYGEVPRGTAVALANAYDRMELAVNGGRADETLGLGRGARVRFEALDGAAVRSERAPARSTKAKRGSRKSKGKR